MDILIEVKLTVTKVVLQCQSPDVTQLPCATTLISCTADNFTSVEQASSTTQPQHSLDPHIQLLVVCGGVLGLMLCCVLATLVILYRKKSSTQNTSLKPPAPESQISHPSSDQEDIWHVYDDMLTVYSLAGPARGDQSSATYGTIQLPAPANNDCSLYSLVTPH
ncbi:uncharacterized protein LOC131353204 isoform X5 [Hemibagrus wyckioides]|nr:uncharacterized protein LOC131353204 isoform X5 [Hemibagrus wyckioides]